MKTHKNFVFSSVKGDYGKDVCSFFQCVVLLDVPRDIRLRRVKNRSFQMFGGGCYPAVICLSGKKIFSALLSQETKTLLKNG